MPPDRPALRRGTPPVAADETARAHLRFIRETMARTATFTAVPGWGGVAMGLVALGAAALASAQATPEAWLRVWVAAAVAAFAIGLVTTWRKARAGGVPILSGAGRKFLLGLLPALAAGAALTLAVAGLGDETATRLLPGVWLLLYGAGVVAAGVFSIDLVPTMGGAFMALGTLALLAPPAWGDGFLAAGFGALQIACGLVIARKHGG